MSSYGEAQPGPAPRVPDRRSALSILVTLLAPALVSLVLYVSFEGLKWTHYLIHTSLEVAGSVVAVLVAALLYLRQSQQAAPHFVWISSALVCMGILDFFHALVEVSPAFYWSRTLATLFGGMLFSGVWLPDRWVTRRLFRIAPVLIAVLSTALGLFFVLDPNGLPAMFSSEGYQVTAKLINFAGGVTFLAAASNLLLRYSRNRKRDDYLFALHCSLFGVAGLLFGFSSMWNSVWWFFHGLRLVAYWVVIRYVYLTFRDAQARLNAAYSEMEMRIEERTERLRERSLALERSEAKLKAVLDHMPVGVGVSDAEGHLEYLNPEGRAIWGGMKDVDPTTYGEYQAWFLDTGKKLESTDWGMAHAILHGKTVQGRRLQIRTFDGQEKYVTDSAAPMAGAQGERIGAVATAVDITDLVHAEKEVAAQAEALRKSQEEAQAKEREFRTLANSINQLAWMADPSGQIYWYNDRWYEYTGLSFEQMRDWGQQQVHHPDHRERVVGFIQEAWKNPKPWELTFPLKSKTGEWRWFLTRGVPVLDAQGKIVKWLGTNTDIQEQKEIQEDLRAALQARDDFLSIASHELKTPIASLKLQTQIARRTRDRGDRSVYAPEKVDRLIDHSERQVERVIRLVDDMLDVARIRAGKLTINREPLVLRELVTEVVERLGSVLKDAGTPVTLDCSEPFEGKWDRFRLEQVVTNLLTNAMRYGERKPVELRLKHSPSDPRRVQLTVRDRGMGIAPEAKERIFNRFERDINANEVSGLGLGLFITRQIVEAHGGTVWVESEGVGQGSTFVVELPFSPDA